MNVQALPRTLINSYLSTVRLPVTAAAKVTGQQDNEQWPPVLAFESFEATVQTLLGSLLRDDELVRAGRLERAKVGELREAADLETKAEAARKEAREQLSEDRKRVAGKRRTAAQRAREREQKAEREGQQRKANVKSAAAGKVAAAKRVETAQEKAIQRRERAATRQALAKEKAALKAEKQALSAAEATDEIGDAIERSKERRTA